MNALHAEFLPPICSTRVQRDLYLRKQAAQQSLAEYIRHTQEAYRRAKPEASGSTNIERVLQRCHVFCPMYLLGRSNETVELARHARIIQDIMYADAA